MVSSAIRISVFLLCVAMLSNCGGRRTRDAAPYETAVNDEREIAVDAYLFDARLWQEGKPTSFRLEIYKADTIAGLSGRGYLGKGALKGKISGDSLIVYFPSTNEYLAEPIANVMGGFDCAPDVSSPELLATIDDDPRTWVPDAGYTLTTVEESGDEVEYLLMQTGCNWQVLIRYDVDDDGWYLEELEFDDQQDTRFTAKRRTLKKDTDVEPKRFQVRLPADAIRIIP